MNKRELAEIKKHFNEDDGLMVVSRVLSAYVDAEKKICGKRICSFTETPADEAAMVFSICKKALSGSIGKNVVEYAFPRAEYEDDGAQKLLYTVLKDGFKTETVSDTLLERIKGDLHAETTYAIFAMIATYSVISKAKDDRSLDMNDLDYNFLITAIAPVSAPEPGLIFDGEAISPTTAASLSISDKPSDGFLFPAFSDRSPDVNSVCVYSKNAAKPNISLVTGVLGCDFVRAAKSEREIFNDLLVKTTGDELDYTKIIQIDEKIAEVVAESQTETELATVDAARIERILADVGVSKDKLAAIPAVFAETAADTAFTAVNLLNSRVNLKTEGITINISGDSTGRLRAQNVNGRRSLIIDLDDPEITINGIETTV
jgi:hypothetical protein